MAEETKFTKEEMDNIGEIQKTYLGLQNAFGQAQVNRIRLQQQLSELDSTELGFRDEFVKNQSKERDF